MKSKIISAIVVLLIVLSSLYVFGLFPESKKDKIAVVEIHSNMISSSNREYYVNTLYDLKRNDSIKGVVLEIDCPGGEASAVEDIYLSSLGLKKTKPVVASIVGVGLSGGYYISLAGDYIYTVPAAYVGSIGVVANIPEHGALEEDVIDTGRYKQIGWSEEEYPFTVQVTLNSFLDSVEEQRGDELKLNRSDLSDARIYMGKEAVNYGLVDESGSTHNAIEKAAEMAEIGDYEVVRIDQSPSSGFTMGFKEFKKLPAPSMNYLYLFDNNLNETVSGENENYGGIGNSGDLGKSVLIDQAHHNNVDLNKLNFLLSKIVENGYSIKYSKEEFADTLNESEALIIMSPSKGFDKDELEKIKEFLDEGHKVLVVFDPQLANSSAANSLLSNFGMFFANGYLYNKQENYGNYRDVWINYSDEIDVKIPAVMYTSTYINGGDRVAYTVNASYSESGMKADYAVISQNDNILAVGDQNFIEQPFCYVEGNPRVVTWIADYLTS